MQGKRLTLTIWNGWKFTLADESGAWQKDYDDRSWDDVILPHDWSIRSGFDISHSSGTGYLPGGVGVYRGRFRLPAEREGGRVILSFDGVYKNAMVWCNGYYLGKRPNGYVRQSYDVSDRVLFGCEENLVTVRVDHRDIADSRWYTGSGIYRKVEVSVTNLVHAAENGIFVTTESADRRKARLKIETRVENSGSEDSVAEVVHSIRYRGLEVASASASVAVKTGTTGLANVVLDLSDPELWSTDSPEVYECGTRIKTRDGVEDEVVTRFGIRTFRFDPATGFSLNGISMKLKGVCVHHDAGCLGAAVRPPVWARRLSKLKTMGCNAIRMSHNPHMEELYDLCDSMGFLVVDEAFDEWEGVKNKWSRGHNMYPPVHYGYYEDFPTWYEADLSAMILNHRNHPSVIAWSIGNEVDYPNDPYGHSLFERVAGNNDKDKPASELVYNRHKPNAKRLVAVARELAAIVKRLDPTRPVTAALAFPELSTVTGLADCLDLAGYNYKEFLYDDDHAKFPKRPLIGSENVKDLDRWKEVLDRPFVAGQFLWTGIDFLGETRLWPCHGSRSGLLDVAGTEKPVYWFRKSLWTSEPTARLFCAVDLDSDPTSSYHTHLSRSWNQAADSMVRVVCFTNLESGELFLNGRSLGTKLLADNPAGFLSWTLAWEPGVLEVKAGGGTVMSDCLVTSGPAAALSIIADRDVIRADGFDLAHVTIRTLDAQGRVVADGRDLVEVSIEGPGVLLGLENGDLEDNQSYRLPRRETRRGELIGYVAATGPSGTCTVTAVVKGLDSVKLELRIMEARAQD